MPTFQYKAIDRSGQPVQGQLKGKDRNTVVSLLARQGRFVEQIHITEGVESVSAAGSRKRKKVRLSQAERVEFINQLAVALQAQLPILSSLRVVGQQNPSPQVKRLATELAEIIESGQSLSHAFAQYGNIFDQLHISLVSAGETAGNLDRSMAHLADLSERELLVRNDIMTAALYPFFVLCLGLVSVGIVVVWILPQILTTLGAGVEVLPWPSRMVLYVGDFLKSPYGWLTMAAILSLVVIFNYWRKSATGRYFWDSFKLVLPVLGTVQRKWAVSRFARTLGTLTAGGIHILQGLAVVRNCLGNELLARDVDKVIKQVRGGKSLADTLRQSGDFPPLLVQIVTVGEQTGKLSELLLNAANAFDKDTRQAIKRFMALFPAVLITILALIVGFIVAATLLPIIQIETALPGM